ncbi:MAG: alkaline phosphatase family protein [Anaerolineae bacterium]|nr:alkaline phosphatase family protein [Anaerolineae bacterium]
MKSRRHIIQYLIIPVVHIIALLLLAAWSEELQIQSASAAIGVAGVYVVTELLYWWLFINFFRWLPVWLSPLLTLALTGGVVMLVGNLIPGTHIADFRTGSRITLLMASVNAILGGLLSLDMESKFDTYVMRQLMNRHGRPMKTEVSGFLFLEIDGLGERVFRRALAKGHLPTLERWLEAGTHKILGWETDFTAQTGAMQTGILLGNNEGVPAYRWWDRRQSRIMMSGDPRDAAAIEARLSNGQGLLSGGGASRGNVFSGDATESLFTLATLLDRTRGRGPGIYLYLVSPFVVAQIVTRSFLKVVKEWWQALRQKLRKDKYIVNARTPLYAFIRAVMGPLLQGLITYTVISDILRGIPAIYAQYAEYDDLAHFAGMETPEAFETLEEIDRYFARIERALPYAPRPYHTIVLSDHGQSIGPTFRAAYGVTLEQLIRGLIDGDNRIFASLNTNEAWDKINSFLNESINADTRLARVLRTALRSKTQDGLVAYGPDRNARKVLREQAEIKDAHLIVLASGCTGLIYFADSKQRLTYEEIQSRYPELILGLATHPGIGFVLVRSAENGDMVLGKGGIYFLDHATYEGRNPLEAYTPNAVAHLKRESSFTDCPDLIVNTAYDPVTEELCSFEDQVSHHGGLGGPQSYPFIFYPTCLPINGAPIIGATGVYRLLRGWRDGVQEQSHSQS